MKPKIYLVGGAVRDKLLGLCPEDNDFVVVGASTEWMLNAGFTQVGKSFPVFLHPLTGQEYALARQERKTSPNYNAFETKHDSSITLEEDLIRRDLTINSIAMDIENESFIDPFNGIQDLKDGILRHTSEAFSEDPVRVLRLARFAAKYKFKIHESTLEISKQIVRSGELSKIPLERIWGEISKGLSSDNPAIMLKVLDDVEALNCDPLKRYFPDGIIFYDYLFTVFDVYKDIDLDPLVKFILMFDSTENFSKERSLELRIPRSFYQSLEYYQILDSYLHGDKTPELILELINRIQFDRNKDSLEMISAIKALQISTKIPDTISERLKDLHDICFNLKQIDMKKIVSGSNNQDIKQKVESEKLTVIKNYFK